jgi:hypothetical protein
MTTRNITTTTRRIVLALGVATAAVVAIPSTQAVHAAGSKPNFVTPSGWSFRDVTPSGWGWRGVTPSGWGAKHAAPATGANPVGWGFQGSNPRGWSGQNTTLCGIVCMKSWGH